MQIDDEAGRCILSARESDVEAVLGLAAESRLANLPPAEARASGFLVSDYSRLDYEGFVQGASYFRVLRAAGRVVGFLLAFAGGELAPDDPVRVRLVDWFRGPFVLVKQVCVERRLREGGLARRLYGALIEETRPTPLAAAVVTSPSNRASEGLHAALGFRPAFGYILPDGYPRMMWVRSPGGGGEGRHDERKGRSVET